jgi:hypothetical protein
LLFTGPESRARRYASEELLNHWQMHPRPTAAFFAGKDTTSGARYTRRGAGSTTSGRFGASARPPGGGPAEWVTESVTSAAS